MVLMFKPTLLALFAFETSKGYSEGRGEWRRSKRSLPINTFAAVHSKILITWP